MAVPAALQNSFERWESAGRPIQVNPWKRELWLRHLPGHADLFKGLDDEPLPRTTPTRWASLIVGPESAERAFVVASVWGYRTVNYGPYRTALALSATRNFTEKIFEIAEVARCEGGLAAYQYIGRQRLLDSDYLKHVGPTYGTKFIYFVTKALAEHTAPAMDSFVYKWLQENVPDVSTRLEPSWSDAATYDRYLRCLAGWATQLSVGRPPLHEDDVEYLIYRSVAQTTEISPGKMRAGRREEIDR